jgi:magnesium-transporting ATPase (P-type)
MNKRELGSFLWLCVIALVLCAPTLISAHIGWQFWTAYHNTHILVALALYLILLPLDLVVTYVLTRSVANMAMDFLNMDKRRRSLR